MDHPNVLDQVHTARRARHPHPPDRVAGIVFAPTISKHWDLAMQEL